MNLVYYFFETLYIQSQQGDNTTALEEFVFPECSELGHLLA